MRIVRNPERLHERFKSSHGNALVEESESNSPSAQGGMFTDSQHSTGRPTRVLDSLRERGAPSGHFFVSIVLDVRHQLPAVDNKTRESIHRTSCSWDKQLYPCLSYRQASTLKHVCLCIGWATAGFTIRSLSIVFSVMRRVRASSVSCECRTSGRCVGQQYGILLLQVRVRTRQ